MFLPLLIDLLLIQFIEVEKILHVIYVEWEENFKMELIVVRNVDMMYMYNVFKKDKMLQDNDKMLQDNKIFKMFPDNKMYQDNLISKEATSNL